MYEKSEMTTLWFDSGSEADWTGITVQPRAFVHFWKILMYLV